jgi:hypothetical protein
LEIQQIRKIYSEAANDSAKADWLYQHLKGIKLPQPAILLAYLAASEALQARNSFFPFTKLSMIQQAQETFSKAVKLDKEDVEIRFLRFTIEVNIPVFLGLTTHIEEDKLLIISNLNESPLDFTMKKAIADFLLSSGYCSPVESQFLKTFL